METKVHGDLVRDIGIIDYGIGNLWSVKHAFEFLGESVRFIDDQRDISKFETLVLPGVGSFRLAMEQIKFAGFDEKICEVIRDGKAKILGICLGMQLLAEFGEEDGGSSGLGLLPGRVSKIDENVTDLNDLKIPHVGFNTVNAKENSVLFDGIEPGQDFYFVHSYALPVMNIDFEIATCSYGSNFVAAIERENVFATQFHPEKSQSNGLKLLNNFINVKI